MDETKEVSKALYDAIVYIAENLQQVGYAPRITDVLVTANNGDGTYQIKYNGKTYNVPLYGNNVITVNLTAKLFIPNDNMSLAFIM